MRSRDWVNAVAAAALVVAVSGCDDADDDAAAPAQETVADSSTAAGADTGLCPVLAVADVADSYGVEIEQDSVGSGAADEGGRTWTYDTCSWETPDEIEVRLAVSTADDFPDGALACPPLSYLGTPGTPVDGLGVEAWWVESGFNEQEGTLRLCTDTHLVDIDADRPSGTVALAALQQQSVDLAAKVLLRLDE